MCAAYGLTDTHILCFQAQRGLFLMRLLTQAFKGQAVQTLMTTPLFPSYGGDSGAEPPEFVP